MAKKLPYQVRKAGGATQKILWFMVLTILVAGWLLLSGLNLYCAVNLTCDPTSLTWWSMLLSVFGLPVLAVQLYLLRKTVEEGTWKPEISIGLLDKTPSPDTLTRMDPLPTQTGMGFRDFLSTLQTGIGDYEKGLGREDVRFRLSDRVNQSFPKLIIRNTGRTAARSLKLQISLLEYPEQHVKPKFQYNKSTSLLDADILVVYPESIIHAGDFMEAPFMVQCDEHRELSAFEKLLANCTEYLNLSRSRYYRSRDDNTEFPFRTQQKEQEFLMVIMADFFSKSFMVGTYEFEIKVWADGMEPVVEKIALEIREYPEELITVLHEINAEAERFSQRKVESQRFNFDLDDAG